MRVRRSNHYATAARARPAARIAYVAAVFAPLLASQTKKTIFPFMRGALVKLLSIVRLSTLASLTAVQRRGS